MAQEFDKRNGVKLREMRRGTLKYFFESNFRLKVELLLFRLGVSIVSARNVLTRTDVIVGVTLTRVRSGCPPTNPRLPRRTCDCRSTVTTTDGRTTRVGSPDRPPPPNSPCTSAGRFSKSRLCHSISSPCRRPPS